MSKLTLAQSQMLDCLAHSPDGCATYQALREFCFPRLTIRGALNVRQKLIEKGFAEIAPKRRFNIGMDDGPRLRITDAGRDVFIEACR